MPRTRGGRAAGDAVSQRTGKPPSWRASVLAVGSSGWRADPVWPSQRNAIADSPRDHAQSPRPHWRRRPSWSTRPVKRSAPRRYGGTPNQPYLRPHHGDTAPRQSCRRTLGRAVAAPSSPPLHRQHHDACAALRACPPSPRPDCASQRPPEISPDVSAGWQDVAAGSLPTVGDPGGPPANVAHPKSWPSACRCDNVRTHHAGVYHRHGRLSPCPLHTPLHRPPGRRRCISKTASRVRRWACGHTHPSHPVPRFANHASQRATWSKRRHIATHDCSLPLRLTANFEHATPNSSPSAEARACLDCPAA